MPMVTVILTVVTMIMIKNKMSRSHICTCGNIHCHALQNDNNKISVQNALHCIDDDVDENERVSHEPGKCGNIHCYAL